MSIQSTVKEVANLTTEIQRLQQKVKALQIQRKKKEEEILNYFEETEECGVKWDNLIITVGQGKKTERKKKKEKEELVLEFMKNNGIKNPERALEELIEIQKGESYHYNKLKYVKQK